LEPTASIAHQVVHGGVFALAIHDPNSNGQTPRSGCRIPLFLRIDQRAYVARE
jgi:hypothetical protein